MIFNLKYIDGITMIDKDGTILYTVRFNPQFYGDVNNEHQVVGKHLLKAFPTLDKETSTLFNVMETGKPLFRARQKIVDFRGMKKTTSNISFPVKANGEIIGAIELSEDIGRRNRGYHAIRKINANILSDKVEDEHTTIEQAKYTFNDIISENKTIGYLKESAKNIAKGTASVFISGKTGTGKELFAHAIHNESSQAKKPFITQNCSALPETLIESILFGTTKGSFTGAEDRPGLFEMANGGTIFLDEINSMPLHLQSKLLRVLEDGYVRRLGDDKLRKVSFRIITAANDDPLKCVEDGRLRADLYYRLAVMNLIIPPLKERKEDIRLLADFFIGKMNLKYNKHISHISKEVLNFLTNYDWPGNIRELENVIEYGITQVSKYDDTLQYGHLRTKLKYMFKEKKAPTFKLFKPLKIEIAELERMRINEAIDHTKGNVSQAAKLLHIPRQTLQRKLDLYNEEESNQDDIFIS